MCEFVGTNSIWVGGSDKLEEGNWVWNNPTQPILLDYWFDRQPDNTYGNQNCLCYGQHMGYLWDDVQCFLESHFVCDLLNNGN